MSPTLKGTPMVSLERALSIAMLSGTWSSEPSGGRYLDALARWDGWLRV